MVGVDLGVTDFAVTSGGERIANPRHLERKARSLARYQRRLARCQEGSANRAKAAAKVARAHRKVRNARRDFLHRASTSLVRKADLIVIEDLAVSNMIRNRHLARAISGCGWGEFRRQLEYKCERYGRHLVVVDRWYPSSKACSACGHLLADLSLSTVMRPSGGAGTARGRGRRRPRRTAPRTRPTAPAGSTRCPACRPCVTWGYCVSGLLDRERGGRGDAEQPLLGADRQDAGDHREQVRQHDAGDHRGDRPGAAPQQRAHGQPEHGGHGQQRGGADHDLQPGERRDRRDRVAVLRAAGARRAGS